MTLLEKARSNRRAALASLQAQSIETDNVVSIFDFEPSKKSESPEVTPAFSSIRLQGDVVRLAA